MRQRKRLVVGGLVSLIALVLAAMVYSVVGTGGEFMGVGRRTDYTVTRVVALSGDAISLANALGATIVKGHGKPGEVAIEATVSLWGWGSQEKAERQIAVRTSKDGLRIVGRGGGWITGTYGFGSMTKFTVTVPDNVNIEVDSKLGRIAVQDVKGSASLKTGTAVIAVEGFQGTALTAESQLGTVSVQDADVSERLSLESGLGSISFSGTPASESRVSSGMGAVNLWLPRDQAFQLNVSQTGPGRVASELPYQGGVVGEGDSRGTIAVKTFLGAVSIHGR